MTTNKTADKNKQLTEQLNKLKSNCKHMAEARSCPYR